MLNAEILSAIGTKGFKIEGERAVSTHSLVESIVEPSSQALELNDLKSHLVWVRKAQAKGDVRVYLNGTLFTKEAIVSTDGHRMHVWYTHGLNIERDAIVDRESMLIISKLLRKDSKVYVWQSEKTTVFEIDRTRVTCFESKCKYPEWRRVLPARFVSTTQLRANVMPGYKKRIKEETQKEKLNGFYSKFPPNVRFSNTSLDLVIPRDYPYYDEHLKCVELDTLLSDNEKAYSYQARYFIDAIADSRSCAILRMSESGICSIKQGNRQSVIMPYREV